MVDADSNFNLGLIADGAISARPSHPAVMQWVGGDLRVTSFGELDALALRWASMLQTLGLRAGERVVAAVGNGADFVACFLGVLRAGLVFVPVDPRAGGLRLLAICRDCRPGVVVLDQVSAYLADRLREAQLNAFVLETQSLVEADNGFTHVAAPNQPALIVYTSGSRGVPKGVLLSSRAAWSPLGPGRARRDRLLSPAERALICTPLSHLAGLGVLKQVLAHGGTSVLIDRFDAGNFLRTLAQARCTRTLLVPAMAAALVARTDLISRMDLSALELISIGGAPAEAELLARLEEAFPNALVVQFYGLTECGAVFTRRARPGEPFPLGSVGVPSAGVEVLLASSGSEDTGELLVKTPAMMSCYFGLDGADSRLDELGFLHTGDIFRRDAQGYFFFVGRADDLIVCGGENLYPSEIEQVLLRHPEVRNAYVVGLPDDRKGQAPAAMVELVEGAAATSETLMTHFLANGPRYGRPQRIKVVTELPLNHAGKVDHAAVVRALSRS
jgi:long-chain acyl-CoA synthetase